MTYKRKTINIFEIQGNYGVGWEMVTAEMTRKEARPVLRLYNENEPATLHRIKLVRMRIIEDVK